MAVTHLLDQLHWVQQGCLHRCWCHQAPLSSLGPALAASQPSDFFMPRGVFALRLDAVFVARSSRAPRGTCNPL